MDRSGGLEGGHVRKNLLVTTSALLLGALSLTLTTGVEPARATVTTFTSTGTQQMFTVPAGVTSIHVVARGGRGGASPGGGPGGFGAVATANLAVTAGDVLYVEVGGNGTDGSSTHTGAGYPGGAGGFNGGGSGGRACDSDGAAGGGGGGSDVRTTPGGDGSPSDPSLNTRLVTAAGGGGADGGPSMAAGGSGGKTGIQGEGTNGGGGGTSSSGGTGGFGLETAGAFGKGGNGEGDTSGCGPAGLADGGGGGGGGLYGGGGGGAASGGGGGSSGFGAGTTSRSVTFDASGIPSVTFTYKAATTTTLVIGKTTSTLRAHGSVSPFDPGVQLSVALYRKQAGVYRLIVTTHPPLNNLGRYSTSFERPQAGSCKVTARFPGDANYKPSTRTKLFAC
jgi:hypothetical protein